MESLIGIRCRDFVLLAADKQQAHSISVMKNDANKLYPLSDHMMMGICGEAGDSVQFAEFIQKNIKLYEIRNGFELKPGAAAHFTQRNLADYLRSRSPYEVNLLLAGYDTINKEAELYWMDYLAAKVKVPFAMHGYAGFFGLSVLDRYYREDLTVDQALDVLKKVISAIQTRLVVSLPAFKIVVIDKDGFRDLPDVIISPEAIGLTKTGDGKEPVVGTSAGAAPVRA